MRVTNVRLEPFGKRGIAEHGTDRTGEVETRGVEEIPEAERHSSPWNLFWIFIGAELTYGVIVTGWLPIAFGLGWWSAVTSVTAGMAVGAIALAPMALLGPRAGTNGAVSSGAFFGVVGRLIGSALALFIAIGFYALTVWTSGQAAVAGAHRLWGTSNSNTALGISYAIMAIVTVVIAIYGHATMVTVNKIMIPTSGLILVVAFFVLLPQFDASYRGGSYLLGSFWPTWFLSFVVAASLPVSYAPFVNDWARYISPKRWSEKAILAGAGVGVFVGCWFAFIFAVYVSTMFKDPATPFVEGLMQTSPRYYLIPLMIVGIFGSFGQGGLALYGTGLDFSSLIPYLRRVPATLLLSSIGVLFIFLGTLVWNIVDSVSAFVLILIVFTTPWLMINIIGYWWRGGYINGDAVQVFNRGEKGGMYWFWHGLNVRGISAWVIGSVVGMMFSNTTLYIGPWANSVSGVDFSFISSAGVSSLVYLALLLAFPEPAYLFNPSVRDRRRAKATREAPALEAEPEVAAVGTPSTPS
jgi:purine-cytosine permease-like protein